MEGWQVALLVLAAVFVGMWIPVSLQLFATLRSGQKFLEIIGHRGEQALGEASTTLVALHQTLSEASSTLVALDRTIADIGELTQAAKRIKDMVHLVSSIAAAVGPAVVALVRALRESGAETEDPTSHVASAEARSPEPAQKESQP
jgi:hypothetical protein